MLPGSGWQGWLSISVSFRSLCSSSMTCNKAMLQGDGRLCLCSKNIASGGIAVSWDCVASLLERSLSEERQCYARTVFCLKQTGAAWAGRCWIACCIRQEGKGWIRGRGGGCFWSIAKCNLHSPIDASHYYGNSTMESAIVKCKNGDVLFEKWSW